MNKADVIPLVLNNSEFKCLTLDHNVTLTDDTIVIVDNTKGYEIYITISTTRHPIVIIASSFSTVKEFVSLEWAGEQEVINVIVEHLSIVIDRVEDDIYDQV
jgi:hypothetical protein